MNHHLGVLQQRVESTPPSESLVMMQRAVGIRSSQNIETDSRQNC